MQICLQVKHLTANTYDVRGCRGMLGTNEYALCTDDLRLATPRLPSGIVVTVLVVSYK